MRFHALGTAQDGGLPHIGCRCRTCDDARRGAIPQRMAASAAVTDSSAGNAWLFDASPDLPRQLHAVQEALGHRGRSGIPLTGVLISHIHMGHYWGLGHLGREGMMPRGLPVLAPPGAARFLSENRPFRDMVQWGAIDVRSALPGVTIDLAEHLSVTPHAVPHRDEFSDTVCWLIEGPSSTVLYAPDMDHLEDRLVDAVGEADMACVDGTFFYADEIPGASGTVPHPPVETSMVRLAGAVGSGTRVAFTHLNHTNPLCDPRSREFERTVSAGFGVLLDGYAIDI